MTWICLVALMSALISPQGGSSCVIPNHFEEVSGNFYKYEWTSEPLIEAKRKCNSFGGHVAEFRTAEQLNQLLSFMKTKHMGSVWAPLYRFTDGCQKEQCQGKLHWLTKSYASQLLFSNLDLTDLDLSHERCVLLDDSGTLKKHKCHKGAKFVCQFNCNNTFSFPQCARNGNNNIYESFGQYIFAYRYRTLTFVEGVKFCQDKGGSLMEPRNSAEYQSAAFMASLKTTHVGIVNPGHQGEDQMLYISDGRPVNVTKLGLTANGYKVEGQKKARFGLHETGDLFGAENAKAYFCQINCSIDVLSRQQYSCSDGTIVPDNYNLWLGQYYDTTGTNGRTWTFLEYTQQCQSSGGYLLQFRTTEEWKAFLVLKGIFGSGKKLWIDLTNFKGSCDTESSCRSNLVWRNDGAPFSGVQDDRLSFDLSTDECVTIDSNLKLASRKCTSNGPSICHFVCDTMPRSDQCDGTRVRDEFFRFNKKFWIAESPAEPKSTTAMQEACENHNATLVAIKSQESFEEARALANLLNNGNKGMIVGLFHDPGNRTWIDGTPFEDTRDVFTQGVDIDADGSVAVISRDGKLESNYEAYQGVCSAECPVTAVPPECLANAVTINDTQIKEIPPTKAVYNAKETRRFDEVCECPHCIQFVDCACLNMVCYLFHYIAHPTVYYQIRSR